MFLSTKRSLTSFTMDLHRIPDKVEAVMDALVDDLYHGYDRGSPSYRDTGRDVGTGERRVLLLPAKDI